MSTSAPKMPATSVNDAAAPPHVRFRRSIVVANPIAGRGRAAGAARELVHGLARLGIESDLVLTKERGEARLALRGRGRDVDLVTAVGGDGTVAEVLDGLVDREVPVAILPVGTANVMSLDLGLPRDVDRVIEMIEHGRTTGLDVARVNGRISFLVTGVGFDACVVNELEALRRGPITKTTWVRAAWNALQKYERPRLKIELDGRPLPGEYGWVLFSNVVHYAGIKSLSSDRRIDDGWFEAYLFQHASMSHLLRYGARALVGRLPGGTCRMQRAKSMRVTSERPTPFHIDGDLGGVTPVEIEVSSNPCRLLIP